MKKIIMIISLITLSIWARGQETYLSCDFNKGIPDTFTLYDADGNNPSIDMERLGFRKGTPWITYYIESERNQVACSTSWYTPAGQSDDWMVTHSIKVKSDKAILSWTAKASDKNYRDGYKVYISDTGKSIADFDRSNPIYSVTAEEAVWTKQIGRAHV